MRQILQFTLSCCIYHLISTLLHKQQINSKIISSLLSMMSGITSLSILGYQLCSSVQSVQDVNNMYNNINFELLCSIMFGYLVVDSYNLLNGSAFSKKERKEYLLHHGIGLFFIAFIGNYTTTLTELAVYTLLTELSSPYANIHAIISIKMDQKMKNNRLCQMIRTINGIILAVLFFATRWIILPCVIIQELDNILQTGLLSGIFILSTYLLFIALNIFWGCKIGKGLCKAIGALMVH